MKLKISEDLALPLDAVTQKFAFLGRTGSGKSYGATKLAEEMLEAKAQVIALDPVCVWWGLRTGKLDVTYLGKLRTLELVSGSKELKASDEFFE